ncbi:hypothetical protein [Listeria fleischmannii]|uniref:hypothetical protein n=1 Tax=Listeria fleischmannii TaxID=1069827 RepID=UPI0004B0EA7E|nr:hypothetical protein [Listeria fleischmannii]
MLLFISSISFWPAPLVVAKGETTLVLYDSLAKQNVTDGNVDLLLRMLASYGQIVRISDMREKLDTSSVDHIIVIQNKAKPIQPEVSEKLQKYGKKNLIHWANTAWLGTKAAREFADANK